MPLELIGWVAAQVQSELLGSQGPPFDTNAIEEAARIHEDAGFDTALVGYFLRRTRWLPGRGPRGQCYHETSLPDGPSPRVRVPHRGGAESLPLSIS